MSTREFWPQAPAHYFKIVFAVVSVESRRDTNVFFMTLFPPSQNINYADVDAKGAKN